MIDVELVFGVEVGFDFECGDFWKNSTFQLS